MNQDLHRIMLKGGVTSPGELKDIVTMLVAMGLSEVYFGSRQDVLFPYAENDGDEAQQNSLSHTQVLADRSYQNIVSSYVSADIFDMTHWLKGSTYLYVLERFDYLPKLKINITDPKQRLVPIFSGDLNFVASQHEDYWYLHIKLPHWSNAAFYPVLIYTWDINVFAKAIEAVYEDVSDVDELFFILNKTLDTTNKAMEKELEVRYLTFPYYEGMNRMGQGLFWLGLYWRNNRYDLKFLNEFCGFCLDNGIGKICITPWKSFIVKGIKSSSRAELERFLGQRGINVRHSQLEMNWHLPVDDAQALELKQYLVHSFDQNDISTYGLTFGISTDPGKRSHFASVVIEINKAPATMANFDYRPTFNVLHFENFDPNTENYQAYAQDVDQAQLPGLLMELSKNYFDRLGKEVKAISEEVTASQEALEEVYQCQNCLTIYDATIGDKGAGIAAGVLFDAIPSTFTCPVCEGAKGDFKRVRLQLRG